MNSSRDSAQRRVDAIGGFREEFSKLIDMGMLTPSEEEWRTVREYHDEVLEDLSERFDIDTNLIEAQLSWGMRIASTFGAVVLAVAVVLGFEYYWPDLSTVMQGSIAAGGALVMLGITEGLAAASVSRYFIAIAVLLAATAFGINVFVLADIFNRPFSLDFVLALGLFTTVLGHRHRLKLVTGLGLVMLIIWLSGRLVTMDGSIFVTAFYRRQDLLLLAGALVFLLPSVPAVIERELKPAWRLVGTLAMGYALLVLSFEGTSMLPVSEQTAAQIYQIAGFTIAGALIWAGLARVWAETVYGAYAVLFAFSLVRIYDWTWDEVPRYVFFLILGLIALLLLWALKGLRQIEKARRGNVSARSAGTIT